jgi:hypothetical protein
MKTTRTSVFAGIKGFKKATPAQLRKHVESVRAKVIPAIKKEIRAKEKGAERARTYKVY